MKLDADTLEIMENWSKKDMQDQIKRLQTALAHQDEYKAKTEDEKDALWKSAGY